MPNSFRAAPSCSSPSPFSSGYSGWRSRRPSGRELRPKSATVFMANRSTHLSVLIVLMHMPGSETPDRRTARRAALSPVQSSFMIDPDPHSHLSARPAAQANEKGTQTLPWKRTQKQTLERLSMALENSASALLEQGMLTLQNKRAPMRLALPAILASHRMLRLFPEIA